MKKEIFIFRLLFLLSCCLPCFSEGNIYFFTQDILENIITNPESVNGTIIFDEMKAGNLKKYGSIVLFNTSMIQHYIDYQNYNIILLTENINSILYIRDYLILKKDNAETHFANGPVEINGSLFDWEVTVVVNHKWRSRFTEDISNAFKVNRHTMKIERFAYNTIRLYSED
jgi:hypothetical protein